MRIESVSGISDRFRAQSAVPVRATSARPLPNDIVSRRNPQLDALATRSGPVHDAANEPASAGGTADTTPVEVCTPCPAWPTMAGQPVAYLDRQLDTAGGFLDAGFDFVGNVLDKGGDVYNTFTDWTPNPLDDLGGEAIDGLYDLQGHGWDIAGDVVEGGFDLTGDLALATGRVHADALIQAGDRLIGRGFVDTPLENRLLDHWLGGSGETIELTGADWQAVATHPATLTADPQGGTPVTLEDGTEGYAVLVDFDQQMPAGTDNSLDGSLGRATLYFNKDGELVGVYDSYDFSNDNAAVDMTNAAGGSVGARNFVVRGGVIAEDPAATVPCPPHMAQALDRLADRIG